LPFLLPGTESILKSRCQNLSEVMATIEKKKGVQGYTSTEKTLEQISSATAALNQTKGKTLEEISLIVTDINSTLNLRKNKLAPQIKKLREVRSEYQEIDAIYQDKKTMFEHTAAGLSAERQRLENECNRYLQEATSQESQYFMVHSLNELEQVRSDKYQMESKFNKGDGALLPDFKTFESFYRHKIELQQTLNQQMRKHHNGMAASAPEDGRQRRIFTVLMTLLNGKKNSLMNGGNIPGDEHGAATAIIDEYGGTNIMTLQQED
jgi:intraflagellar transport protein 81